MVTWDLALVLLVIRLMTGDPSMFGCLITSAGVHTQTKNARNSRTKKQSFSVPSLARCRRSKRKSNKLKMIEERREEEATKVLRNKCNRKYISRNFAFPKEFQEKFL